MSSVVMSATRALRVRLARSRQVVGWAGLCGVAMLLAAAVALGLGWTDRPALRLAETAPKADGGAESAAAAAVPSVATLAAPMPRSGDATVLLRQLERIAVGNGFAWSAADYRVVPPSDAQPSRLEVRSTFNGPYPKLRRMIVDILRDIPASTLMEFSLNRASSESADVEARLVIAVILDTDSAPDRVRERPAR